MFRTLALSALLLSAALPTHALEIVAPTNGVLTVGDATQSGRINRFLPPSTWASPKAFPGMFTTSGTRRYDLISVPFADNAVQDIYYEIELESTSNLMGIAYLNSFNPADFSINYLGDRANSTSAPGVLFQVIVPVGGTLALHVHDTDPDITSDANYTYRVTAFSDANRGENFLITSVSEPATLSVMGLGLLGLAAMRRRKQPAA
jgi:hypothetical protein